MGETNFDSLVVGGVPVNAPIAGNVFYVGNGGTTEADSANNGTKANPFATLAYAVSRCTANNGDVIYVLPLHTETLAVAAAITINIAGITVIGLGSGRSRPTFTWTATASQLVISAANVTIKNCIFDLAGIDAVVAGFSITGADVSIDENEFIIATGTAGCVLGILTAATAARLRIRRNRFVGPAVNSGTTCTACIKHEVGVDYEISENYFTGKMTQAILNATALLRGLIDSNRFVIATGTLAISVHASSTPFIVNNFINVPSGTTPITAAAGFVAGNKYSAAAGVTAGTALTI